MIRSNRYSWLFALLLLPLLAGCGARARNAVPEELVHQASIPNFSSIRFLLDVEDKALINSFAASFAQEDPSDFYVDIDGVTTYPTLAISGGGAGGAYSAGVLEGWSRQGSRPTFKVVTGISTGAIIAPFAFVGRKYDPILKKLYTTITAKDVMKRKSVVSAFFGSSLADSTPLERFLKSYYTPQLLEEVAQAHERGRRLYVGTTNLDTQRLVIWDLGKLAATRHPEALDLFRKIIFASTAIPALFEPVFFDVEAGGEMYDEMHVDGGNASQIFFPYSIVKLMRGAIPVEGLDVSQKRLSIYALRSGLFAPYRVVIPTKLVPIANRALETFVTYQTMGDVYRLFAIAQARDVDFYLGHIPNSWAHKENLLFGTEQIRELYDIGYGEAVGGYPWKREPPQWELTELNPSSTETEL